ncbi:hypothetical protein GLAREA_03953 [Glarea lozoyensis ATCC 20868]|uniref:Uncharacterized protein n=1 Tax=Glarea lozoyensis (strain ATCC 20868 / MF5171) TaxID=1116229 RepID=S3DG51_GLAL2|nr:uncharacterized protein GLAREA_03953 [Glarea lozoyensis ATCC 20868]EPE30986.1 hypothetical protein GLAREA_03953 [Glarea lozoyensis ATCC 20868]
MEHLNLYRRIFNRSEAPNVDVLVEEDFRKYNLTDFFGGIWLTSPDNVKELTLNDVLLDFWSQSTSSTPRNSFDVFCVADGGGIPATTENSKWLNQLIRFAAFASGGANGPENPFEDRDASSWTLCIVGSQELNSTLRFLQVASWDTKVFRYYGRDSLQLEGISEGGQKQGWVYQGVSTEAFSDESYLGPFNGHVNGGLIMKEIHKPWLHWMTDANDPTPNFTDTTKEALSKVFAPYLSDSTPLSKVNSADNMEPYITDGISAWFTSRWKMDFLDAKRQPLPKVKGLKRWMAHILLTTSINIQTALPFQNQWLMPANNVLNFELLSQGDPTDIWPMVENDSFPFSKALYDNAVKNDPQLALITNVDTDNVPAGYTAFSLDSSTIASSDPKASNLPPISFIQVAAGEGDQGTFTILHPSLEDAKGAHLLMTDIQKKFTLLSKETYNAMIMVDPWNPLYSWKRGVLLQYVPDEATYNASTKSYDMEKSFIDAVNTSPRMKDPTSPEYEFIRNLSRPTSFFSAMMSSYISKVQKRLKTQDGISDYLKLAESRRRIYRPLPLDEFAFTLPWALSWKYSKPLEMTSEGAIQDIDVRGQKFFATWIGALRTANPMLIPRADADDQDDLAVLENLHAVALATKDSQSLNFQESGMRLLPKACGASTR